MTAPVSIRPGRAEDAGSIHAALRGIAETMGEPGKVKSTPDDMRRFGFGENPAFETLIAEVNGTFAGLCLYFPSFSTWRGQRGVYVQDLYVPEKFRGLGIGERLLRRLAAVARQSGGGYIRLAVDRRNSGARAFYERVGIRLVEEERVHAAYREDFDALANADDDPRVEEKT